MEQKIKQRIDELSHEVHKLYDEKKAIQDRISNIDIRVHQIVGALLELQNLCDSSSE